jgi:hypothetical protein
MITVVVVAVPEGLPMMITVVLSSNMSKMINDKIMVKKLVGIETAGSMNILFTDKTGTLTEGKTVCDRIITPIGIFKKHSSMAKEARLYESFLDVTLFYFDLVRIIYMLVSATRASAHAAPSVRSDLGRLYKLFELGYRVGRRYLDYLSLDLVSGDSAAYENYSPVNPRNAEAEVRHSLYTEGIYIVFLKQKLVLFHKLK